MSSVRVGLLNNLRAGRSGRQVSRALELLRLYPDVVHVETDSARVLPEALGEFAKHDVQVLVVNGGDGTLQYALTELLTNPDLAGVRTVAPLRGGRTNMTASDLGATRDPIAGLRAVLDCAAAGRLADRAVPHPVLRVGSSRRPEPQYGMFFGIGLLQRAVQFAHRVMPGTRQGVLGAGLVTGALVPRLLLRPREGILTPDKADIRIDGELVAGGEFYLGLATTLDRLFLGLDPFWGEGPGPVRFTAVTSRPARFAAAAPGILRGRPRAFVTPEHGYTSRNAEVVGLRMGCGFTIDGEIFEPIADETVTVEADRRIRLLRA